ncbi:MAG: cyclodeaminase/cyclohydrolase family protein [Bacillota bacterium]|jgi:formiminotetrahydrofolate cyclodeaminase|nr:cyclodeaminase/cyclohydrolase family protein [Candidatus Fermentithermobacillaceae bacterium]
MSDLFSRSLRDVLKVSASSEPTPGGGSIAAITAAFAASMVGMVCNLTIGKKRYKSVEEQVIRIRDRAMALMNRAEDLVEADMTVFGRFMECYKMPAGTDEEKERRQLLIQEALKGATGTPLDIARAALSILELVDELAPIGSQMAISDAGVAAYLADAAVRAALLNVDINVPLIKDAAFRDEALANKNGLLEQAAVLKERAAATVSRRLQAS